MDTKTKLIVGLGNPGGRYEQTKHNVGFRVVDALDAACGESRPHRKDGKPAKYLSPCKAIVAENTLDGVPIILAKPMTYMNNSGTAVAALLKHFQVPLSEICVVYDDVHLAVGTLRIRQKGRDGGQKGMKSIIQHVGTTEFPRLRIGIGEPSGGLSDHVLTTFSVTEEAEIAETIQRAVSALETFITTDILTAMNRFNRRRTD